jgi:hypothetical protein
MRPNKLKNKRWRNNQSQDASAGLAENFELRLAAYAKAAGAAGVGLLALAPPASAKVVYTPAHIVFLTGARCLST